MKIIVTSLLVILLFARCSKDKSETTDTSLKTVTYTFAPNGANSQISYTSVQLGKTIGAGYHFAIYSVNDQVKIGDKIHLQMQTTDDLPQVYEIRILFSKKLIAVYGTVETAGNIKTVAFNKTFTKED